MYARYTEYLRDIMKNPLSKDALEAALSTYPLYQADKTYDLIPTRQQLNKKLLDHWKYREIAFETVGRFVDELEITMCEIMPYYNEMFKTIVTMAELPNPFDNVDVVETFEQERSDTSSTEGTNSSTNVSTGRVTNENDTENSGTSNESATGSTSGQNTQTTNGKNVKVDTPASALDIGAEGIDSLDYASEANWNKDVTSGSETGTSENATERSTRDTSHQSGTQESEGSETITGTSGSTSESSGTVTHTMTRKGNQGVNTYAHDMNEFRTSIMDVVEDIITDDRIAELFMQVY